MTKIDLWMLRIGLGLSCVTGAWHFILPYQYKWFDYMTSVPRVLVVSVEWTNFFFSLLLFGISLLLLININTLLSGQRLATQLFGFIAFVWLCRVVITIVRPWNDTYDWMFWSQTTAFVMIFILLTWPYIKVIKQLKVTRK